MIRRIELLDAGPRSNPDPEGASSRAFCDRLVARAGRLQSTMSHTSARMEALRELLLEQRQTLTTGPRNVAGSSEEEEGRGRQRRRR